MKKYNLYCDESCYLENDKKDYMILGTVKCPKGCRKNICKDIRAIKLKYGIKEFQELKWTKISPKKQDMYVDIVNYFFNNHHLTFRCIVVDKNQIHHDKFNQSHDDFYYKVYYQLLIRGIIPKEENYIYLDIKDTKNTIKIRKLQNCLQNGTYDFNSNYIKRIQSINSQESELLQLADILIGAVGYAKRNENKKNNYSKAKDNIVNLIKEKSGYDFNKSTFLSEEKFNIFLMELKDE